MRWQAYAALVLCPLFYFVVGVSLTTGQVPSAPAKAQQLFTQAQALEAKKKNAEALALMLQAIQLAPKSDALLGYTAKLELQCGKPADCAKHALQAAQLNGKNPQFPALVMRGAYRAKDFEQAREYASKVMALDARQAGQQPIDEARAILAELDALAVHQTGLDRHALSTPADVENSLDSLAAYLIQPATNDREKALIIFRWVTDRIAYDVEGLLSGQPGDSRARRY